MIDVIKAADEVKSTGILIAAALVVGVGVAIYIEGKKVYDTVTAPGAFNPTSSNNLAYQGANAILSNQTGGKYTDLGTAIYQTKDTNVVSAAAAKVFDWIGHVTGQLQ